MPENDRHKNAAESCGKSGESGVMEVDGGTWEAAGGLTGADAGASRRFQTHPGSKSALAAQPRPGLAHLGQFPVGVFPVPQELPEQLPALLPTTPLDLVMLSPNSWGIVQNQKSSIIQTLP